MFCCFADILTHASLVYTATIFRFFEFEFEACLLLKCVPDLDFGRGRKKMYLLSSGKNPEEKQLQVNTDASYFMYLFIMSFILFHHDL